MILNAPQRHHLEALPLTPAQTVVDGSATYSEPSLAPGRELLVVSANTTSHAPGQDAYTRFVSHGYRPSK